MKNGPASLLRKVPNWPAFERLGRSRIVRSTYVWVFVVPIVARAFSGVPEMITIPWLGTEFHIALRLPFSWVMGYYAALSFALGTMTYQAFSPAFVKRYSNYPEYHHDERGALSLMTQFARLHMRRSMFWPLELGVSIKKAFLELTEFGTDVGFLQEAVEKTPIARLQSTSLKAGKEAAAFYIIHHQLSRTYVLARLLCLLSYSAGFILLGRVAWDSFVYVLQST